jgi:hypothetical protein
MDAVFERYDIVTATTVETQFSRRSVRVEGIGRGERI